MSLQAQFYALLFHYLINNSTQTERRFSTTVTDSTKRLDAEQKIELMNRY